MPVGPVLADSEPREVSSMEGTRSLFEDELISATELNRQSGRVLELAKRRPVTITRNNDAFVLMERREARRLAAAHSLASTLLDLLDALGAIEHGEDLAQDHPYHWVAVFERDERTELLDEVSRAFRRVVRGKSDADEFHALLHEWEESALAASSETLARAFAEPADPVELSPPPVAPEERE